MTESTSRTALCERPGQAQLRFAAAWTAFFLALTVLAAALLWLAGLSRNSSTQLLPHAWGGLERYEPAPQYRAARGTYPYSVIPGGVTSAEEVESSIALDALVAEHYQGIRTSLLRTIRLNAGVEVYASFRTASGIHWTARPIAVAKGELVLTDGANLIRGRCGNRLAFAPPDVVPPGEKPANGEPPVAEPPQIVMQYGMPPLLSFLSPAEPKGPPSRTQPAHYWPPPVAPIVWCCPLGWAPATTVASSSANTPAVPEPASVVLLATSTFFFVFWFWRRKQAPRAASNMAATSHEESGEVGLCHER